MAQTAEGALHESSDILQSLRSLGLQAANGSNDSSDRQSIQYEVVALQDELDRVAITTTFADKTYLMDLTVHKASILARMPTQSL